MCKILILSSETDQSKCQEIQRAKVASKADGDKLFFLFGKDAFCAQKIKQLLKKKKPEKVFFRMSDLQRAKAKEILRSLGVVLKPVDPETYVVVTAA